MTGNHNQITNAIQPTSITNVLRWYSVKDNTRIHIKTFQVR